MAQRTVNIGLSLGADICWPIAYETLLDRLALDLKLGRDRVSFACERVTIKPFDLRQPVKYDVVIDRLTHWYTISREWIKKAVVLNDLYVYNNPWSIQSNEKHTSYAAMMRLGLPNSRNLDAAGEVLRARRRLGADAPAVCEDVLAEGDRREGRLSLLYEALSRGRLARRHQDRQPGRVSEGLRRQRHGSHEPAEGGDSLRLVRALHGVRSADAEGELRPLRGAARPLHHGHEFPFGNEMRRCWKTPR